MRPARCSGGCAVRVSGSRHGEARGSKPTAPPGPRAHLTPRGPAHGPQTRLGPAAGGACGPEPGVRSRRWGSGSFGPSESARPFAVSQDPTPRGCRHMPVAAHHRAPLGRDGISLPAPRVPPSRVAPLIRSGEDSDGIMLLNRAFTSPTHLINRGYTRAQSCGPNRRDPPCPMAESCRAPARTTARSGAAAIGSLPRARCGRCCIPRGR